MKTVEKIERFILDYVSFEDSRVALPLALWVMCTHVFNVFDAFPYLVITSMTKRSGKTRLSEILGLLSRKPMSFSAMTPATLFRVIQGKPNKPDTGQPTIIFDEAEMLSSEAASTMRAVLNVGYRKGQMIPRVSGDEVEYFETYCPKIFVLIGDVYDTLRDRSIVVSLVRGQAAKRFSFDTAKTEAGNLVGEWQEERHSRETSYSLEHWHKVLSIAQQELTYLSDRDAEIWLPIITLGGMLLSPERFKELQTVCVDLCAGKTATKKRFTNMDLFEDEAQNAEYAEKLLRDLQSIFLDKPHIERKIFTDEAVERLRALPLSPWRKFKGDGITANGLADLLSRFGVRPVVLRKGKVVQRGYMRDNVEGAISAL